MAKIEKPPELSYYEKLCLEKYAQHEWYYSIGFPEDFHASHLTEVQKEILGFWDDYLEQPIATPLASTPVVDYTSYMAMMPTRGTVTSTPNGAGSSA